MHREKMRKYICFFCVFCMTAGLLEGCGASTQKEQEEAETELQVISSLYDDSSEVPDMYGVFQVETVEIEGQSMYRLSLEDRPDFEFLMDEGQTTGTVICNGKSISFPLKCRLFDSYSGYANIAYQDYTGDGIEDFVYSAMPYTEQEDKTYAGIPIWGGDTTVVDLETAELVPLEELGSVADLPRTVPVTIAKCTSSETYYDAAWQDEEKEQTLNGYLFSWEGDTHYGYGDSENSYATGEQAALELSYIYVGEGNGELKAILRYAFSNHGMISDCVSYTIPYRYDAERGTFRLALEEGTYLLESVSYLEEAKEKEGQVIEISNAWLDQLVSYEVEFSEQDAISTFMSTDWELQSAAQKCLYYVNYPDSEDKSAVYLVTLANQEGYLYVYETGEAHRLETGDCGYVWQVKEISYTAEKPGNLTK